MRELRPIVKCDRCNDEDLPADTASGIVDVSLPGTPLVRFSGENCPACSSELDEKLTALLAEFLVREDPKETRKRQRKSPSLASVPAPASALPPEPSDDLDVDAEGWTAADRTCPMPECAGKRPRKTRGALGQHLKVDHNTGFNALGMSKVGRRRGALSGS